MSIKFRVLGGGVFWVFLGGKCRFYFYGREDFSELRSFCSHAQLRCWSRVPGLVEV